MLGKTDALGQTEDGDEKKKNGITASQKFCNCEHAVNTALNNTGCITAGNIEGKKEYLCFHSHLQSLGRWEFGGVKRRKRGSRRKQKKLVSWWLHISCENTLKNKVLAI